MNRLEQTLIDMIQEQQVKLGYVKETIRLYFPESSIQYLIDGDESLGNKSVTDKKLQDKSLSGEALSKELGKALSTINPSLGAIRFVLKGDRFALIIPPQGSAYVHEEVAQNAFLTALIQLFGSQQVDLEKVKELFAAFDADYVCQEADGIEFDYLFYFNKAEENKYYYCVKFHGAHASYHRFNEHDIKDIDESFLTN
jgi:hypothetical protein